MMNINSLITNKNSRMPNTFYWLSNTNSNSNTIHNQYTPLPNKYQTIINTFEKYKLLSYPTVNIYFIPIISLVSFLFGYNVGQITNK